MAQYLDTNLAIAALRTRGAERFDPVSIRFIEVLADRALQQQGDVKLLLEDKLAAALAAFEERFLRAQIDTRDMIARTAARYPDSADELQRLFDAGDFAVAKRFAADLKKNEHRVSLTELTRYIAQHSLDHAEGEAAHGKPESLSELKTTRYFRNTWAKLSVDKRVAQAIEKSPENAGPLNSQLLVLRSLALMRDISPDYLNRFVCYVDTLLWLEDTSKKNRPAAKKPAMAKRK